jgi:PKD repeat protein
VHNSLMYVAKLPGRQLLDPGTFDTGEKASKTHAWWSGSGNDFDCAPQGARNLDISIPGLAALPAGTTVKLSMKSLWDIEWDYDYGYVLTTTDGGKTYASNESENGYTTPNAGVPGNANQNACQAQYDNGLTGSSGSYEAGTQDLDRVLSDYPEAVFLADSFDISELAGQQQGALRFSYATDPGLARPGWFIDDLKVTATTPSGQQVLLETDFETTGGPDDARIFNGGCREDLTVAQSCTLGWKYLQAGAESEQDHAYYLEMRDRSGFDNDGHGQIDRDPIGFEAGLYLAYTDEAHGYGNAGTADPPAQSPLDATPEPGSATPNLNDAAFTAATGRSTYSDSGEGHTDNYSDPANTSTDSRYPDVANPWRFRYDCLGFQVLSMQGGDVGPPTSDGDLTGSVKFTMGQGCGRFDYGYTPVTAAPANTAPTASATATPTSAGVGEPVDFTASGSLDTESPHDLDYSWDFGNGGSTKDASGVDVTHAFPQAGTYDVTVTVTDPMGATDRDTVTVTVAGDAPGNQAPTAAARIMPEVPYTNMPVTMTGRDSSDAETSSGSLVYEWSFGDGGDPVDAVGMRVRTSFKEPGYRTISLTVTDAGGKSTTVRKRVLVRHEVACNVSRVDRPGSWRTVRDGRVRGGSYCDNAGRGSGRDVMSLSFRGPQVDVWFGRATGGGTAKVLIDGKRVGTLSFAGAHARPVLTAHRIFSGLGQGRHHVRLVVLKGKAFVEGFGIIG